MSSLVNNMEILSEEIRKAFGELEIKGFQFQSPSLENTKAIGDYVELLVSNAATGRSLIFIYIPEKGERREGLCVSLMNGNDTFSLDEFLINKNINFKMDDLLSLSNYEGTLKEKIADLLIYAKKIIFQYLDKFLFGEEWESIPIYWGDAK